MSPDPRRVLVVGDVATDVVGLLEGPLVTGSDASASVQTLGGGGGANVATWLAHLGVPVSLVGRVGDDDAGRARTAELVAAGVDAVVTVDPDRPTGTVIVLVDHDGERTMVPDRGANRNLRPGDLPVPVMTAASHLHLSAYALLDPASGPAARAILLAARDAGLSTSVDPSSTAPLVRHGVQRFRAEVAGVDLLLPNAAEAIALTGASDAGAAARELAQDHRLVVVSCGAAGAVWATDAASGHVEAVDGPVLDTTGAGDAFTAGVLRAWTAGAGPAGCAAAGTAVAARAIAVAGARPR